MKRLTAISLAISGALLGACAAGGGMYSQPYAEFVPERRSAVEDTRPAMVMKIDGAMTDITRNDPVPPGRHVVEVSIPGPPGMSDPERATLTIDAKPCTRYLLAAKRANRAARDWDAFVAATEPIGECAKKFPGAY